MVTLLRVKPGYVNDKGEVYNESGTFIDFPRELGSKTRANLDISSVVKRFANQSIGCLVHERRNYSYYHWTYETLPKLIYLSQNKSEIKLDKVYLHYGFRGLPYQRQAVKKFGYQPWQILDAKRLKTLMAKEIVLINLNEANRNPSAELCETIRTAFIKNSAKSISRKIYLTREHIKTGRKVVNEIQLGELLKNHGFQTVITDKLTVESQAKIFNEASYIISPHGAALANLVFCKPQTRIIELFNRSESSDWSPLYSKIAKTCGLELIQLPPKQVVQESEIRKVQHRANFIADLSAIQAVFRHWGL